MEIGKKHAEEFYGLSLSVVQETVLRVIRNSNQKIDAYWAVAEKEAKADPRWKSFECIWTGDGGLGERINHVYEELLSIYDQVIIIGSDSPQITSDYLLNAIENLSRNHVDGVIGPCRDGGFVLFGSKSVILKSIWTNVVYSREDTLKQLILHLENINYRYRLISELGDVDNYDDLIALNNDYAQLGLKLQPQQRKLLYWLQEILFSRTLYQNSQYLHVYDAK